MLTSQQKQNHSIVATLESLGWLRAEGAAIATKNFMAVDVQKSALAYISQGDGFNRTLSFEYISEGRNIAAADGVLIPVGSSAEDAAIFAAKAAEKAERSIQESYGVRMNRLMTQDARIDPQREEVDEGVSRFDDRP